MSSLALKKEKIMQFNVLLEVIKNKFFFSTPMLLAKSVGHTVKRHVKGRKRRISISGPNLQVDYIENFNTIDINNHDSAEYSVSL